MNSDKNNLNEKNEYKYEYTTEVHNGQRVRKKIRKRIRVKYDATEEHMQKKRRNRKKKLIKIFNNDIEREIGKPLFYLSVAAIFLFIPLVIFLLDFFSGAFSTIIQR